MKQKDAEDFHSLIGQALAGNGRLSGGITLLSKYPERYQNAFTDWVDLLIAEAKAKQSLALSLAEKDAAIRQRLQDEPTLCWNSLSEGTNLKTG